MPTLSQSCSYGLAVWAPFRGRLCHCRRHSKPTILSGQSLCQKLKPIILSVPFDGRLLHLCSGCGTLSGPYLAHLISLDQPAHLVSQGESLSNQSFTSATHTLQQCFHLHFPRVPVWPHLSRYLAPLGTTDSSSTRC